MPDIGGVRHPFSVILYKYIGVKFGSKVLANLRLKVSPPNEFNDPFEVTPCTRFPFTIEGLLEAIDKDPERFRSAWEGMRKEGLKRTFEQFLRDSRILIPRQFDQFRREYMRHSAEHDLNSIHNASEHFGILCLSEPNDSIAMWSYYAQDHRGVAYGVEANHRSFKLEEIDRFGKVTYKRNRSSINPELSHQEIIEQMNGVFFRKSKVWEHEKEHRRFYALSNLTKNVIDGRARYFVNIDPEAIREIVFGSCVDRDLEMEIRSVISRYKYFRHIKLYRCQRHPKRFRLNIVPA